MAEFELRLQLQGDVEKTVRVNRDEFVVGRLPVCDLHLPFLEISQEGLPDECVVSETTFARLSRRQGLVEMKHYRFKGINQPVLIYQTKRISNKTLSSKYSHLKSSHLLTVVPSATYHSRQDNQR
jgi:hypothetical protein